MNRLFWIILPIFILVFLQFLISNIKILTKSAGGDFKYFYNTGQRVLLGANPYVKEGEGLLRNPPPSLFLYGLLPLFPIQLSQIIFWIFSVFSFLTGSFFLFKLINQSYNLKVWLIYLISILIFFPFRYTLGSGHINNILFMLLILFFYFLKERRVILSGISLALSISLSITPAFLLFIILLQRRYKAVLWTILALTIISTITYLKFGADIFRNYQIVSKTYFDFGISAYYNQSLAAFITRLSQNQELTKFFVFIALGLALLIFLFFQRYSKNNLSQNLIIWSISILYMLIFAPFAWQYHFVIVIFPLVTTTYLAIKNKLSYLFFFFLILSYLMIGWNIKNPHIFEKINILGPIILSHVLIGAVLLLLLNFYQLKKLLR